MLLIEPNTEGREINREKGRGGKKSNEQKLRRDATCLFAFDSFNYRLATGCASAATFTSAALRRILADFHKQNGPAIFPVYNETITENKEMLRNVIVTIM